MSGSGQPNVVVVLAAIIERHGTVLVTRRLKGTHLAGFWEFPGGKCEPDESHEQCLRRELEEELGVDAAIGAELYATEHTYPERTVRLHFRACTIRSEPVARLGQDMRWMARADLDPAEFPPADAELILRLKA